MVASAVERLASIFAAGFFVAYWGPAAFGLVLSVGVGAAAVGPNDLSEWWADLTGSEQAAVGMIAFFVVTATGLVLHALTVPMVQAYEGSWPSWAGRPTAWAKARQRRTWDALGRHLAIRYARFPRARDDVRPTELGNTLAAAEDHPRQLYGVNAAYWWPRLAVVLPATLRNQIEVALTPVVGLLNLSAILLLTAVVGGGITWWLGDGWQAFVAVFLGGSFVAWILYRAAAIQARRYGNLFRLAFDLHRHDVLRGMRITVPQTLQEEMLLWPALAAWLSKYELPWDTDEARYLTTLRKPFHYSFGRRYRRRR